MYSPAAFAIDDLAHLHDFIRTRRFAVMASTIDEAVAFAYAPVHLDVSAGSFGSLRFHLARANPMAATHGRPMRLTFLGPDAYISPDWYETEGLVPTWNYIAVEVAGRARLLGDGELRSLLVDLSAGAEDKLQPKTPWKLDKIPEQRIAGLMKAIRGFEVQIETIAGKAKLSQDKSPADHASVIAALEARGDRTSLGIADAMRETASRPTAP
ncbi:MAG TPA: FMN-binding negative transcriptional regulator [Rhizomicrobium sp.]|jgi:transcriptional regulator